MEQFWFGVIARGEVVQEQTIEPSDLLRERHYSELVKGLDQRGWPDRVKGNIVTPQVVHREAKYGTGTGRGEMNVEQISRVVKDPVVGRECRTNNKPLVGLARNVLVLIVHMKASKGERKIDGA